VKNSAYFDLIKGMWDR